MKRILAVIIMLPAFGYLMAQNVGIGTQTPHSSAQLDVTSSNKGVLVPRISLTDVLQSNPVATPSEGLLVWNINANVTNGQGVGFYFWTGSRWQNLVKNTDDWSLTGNSVDTAIHFIGTTNNAGLMFRVGNQKAGGIFPDGNNTFLGKGAGQFVVAHSSGILGRRNTFMGYEAGLKEKNGSGNTYIGNQAGENGFGAVANTFLGNSSGLANTSGNLNTAVGASSGNSTTGTRNVSVGFGAGWMGPGIDNVMIGYYSGRNIQGGNSNVWIGSNAGTGNYGLSPQANSDHNVFIGDSAAYQTNGAQANVFIGKRSGMNSLASRFNVFVGDSSGLNNSSGNQNTYIGSKARGSNGTITNATAIGANAQAGADNVLVLGSINGVNGATNSVHVGIGTTTPNRRLYIQDGTSSGVTSSVNSLLVLDKTGGPNYLSILNESTFESGLIFGRAGSSLPAIDGGIIYNAGGSGAMQFRNKGGLPRMYIHDNGNVSIGQNNNGARLWVAPGGLSSGIVPYSNSTLVLDGGGIPQYLSMLSTGVEQGIIFGTNQGGLDAGIFYAQATRNMKFMTAGNSRMVIDNTGNLGIGTTIPDFRLHVVTTDAQNFGYREGIMVENIADGAGNTGEAAISFKNRGDLGTGINQWMVGLNQSRNLAFAYGTEFAGGSVTKVVIDSTGKVGIGTTSPSYQLELSQNSAAKPGSNAWTVSSDERLKKDMYPFEDGLNVLEKINPIWFTYTGAENHPQEQFVGATAQAIQQVAPYMVTTLKEKSTVGDKLLGVDYGPLQFIMVNAIKEQQQIIEEQKEEIQQLKKRLDAMEKRRNK